MRPHAVLAFLLLAFGVASCSGASKNAKPANVAELRLDIVQAALNRAKNAADAGGGPVTPIVVDARCDSTDAKGLEAALHAADESLLAAKTAAGTWRLQGDDSQWRSVAPQLREKLVDVRCELIALRLPVPQGLVEGLTAVVPCCVSEPTSPKDSAPKR